METLRRIILVGFIASIAMLTACEEEEDDKVKTMDKEEAVNVLQSSSQDIEEDLQEMNQTKGMQAMGTLTMLSQMSPMPMMSAKSFEYEEGIVQTLQKTLKQHPKQVKRIGDEPFNFDEHTGTYSWDSDSLKWDFSDNTESEIIIEFPTDTSMSQNNAVLTINNYSETQTTLDGDEQYVPTNIVANLTINDEPYMSLTYSASFSDDQMTSMEMELTLNPFTYKVNTSGGNSVSASIMKNQNTLLSTNLTFTFTSSEMEEVERVEGNLRIRQMNLKGWIKPAALNDTSAFMQNASTTGELIEYLNQQFDISLYDYDSDNKIADVKVVEAEGNTGTIEGYPIQLVFVFNDGSQTPVQEYFQGIITYMQNLMGNYGVNNIDI
jgi:hypothetical protein